LLLPKYPCVDEIEEAVAVGARVVLVQPDP
jgi:hypothetical protein